MGGPTDQAVRRLGRGVSEQPTERGVGTGDAVQYHLSMDTFRGRSLRLRRERAGRECIVHTVLHPWMRAAPTLVRCLAICNFL